MHCMKCGKKIGEDAVFCEICLANMEQHPVKPGTPVNLPHRDLEEKKAPSKKLPATIEERLVRSQTAIKWLAGLLAVTILLLSVTAAMLASTVRERDNQSNIGQNYSAVED